MTHAEGLVENRGIANKLLDVARLLGGEAACAELKGEDPKPWADAAVTCFRLRGVFIEHIAELEAK